VRAHFVLYVSDQAESTAFYAKALDMTPALDVPGMTEFSLNGGATLGLMPESGIRCLLGPALPDMSHGHGIPRAELYLVTGDAREFHARALAAGARELSPVAPRDWGDLVGYSLDPDGHVVAFAQSNASAG
jgi:uncharacterized protein